MKQPISPSYFNTFIVLTIIMHFILPIKTIIYAPYNYSGLVIIFVGLVMNIWAINTLKVNNSTIEFRGTSQKLVVTGPFRISRNPLYLGGVMILFGMAVLLGSIITFLFPILLFALLNGIYIPNEEKRLESIFGASYLEYKHKVRRWI